MILPVRLYTDILLSKTCQLVTDFNDPSLELLVAEMITTMLANNGVGLAANQIGTDKAIAVLHVENRTKIMVLVNPRVVSPSKKKIKIAEGCLSAPGLTVQMKRPVSVVVEANTITGEQIKYEFTDFDSKIAQHEIDHLNGKHLGQCVVNYAKI